MTEGSARAAARRAMSLAAATDGVRRIRVVDSHTGGEPTRVVIDGAPRLCGPPSTWLEQFCEHHDTFRSAVIHEPRGSDVLVGALLAPPLDPSCVAATMFFNNVGVLGMCGHGTIGLVATLAWLGRLGPGTHRIETPVGIVTTELHDSGEVSVENVPAYRHRAGVTVDVPGHGPVTGDVAWGGNWFFLVDASDRCLGLTAVEALTEYAWAIRQALERTGITGADGAVIDHVELFGRPDGPDLDSRNFVLCPGRAYDRSPCGTGTSAKLACLAADGALAPGAIWRQQSITGSVFDGFYRRGLDDRVVPTIRGRAWIIADSTLLFDPADPLRDGIRISP